MYIAVSAAPVAGFFINDRTTLFSGTHGCYGKGYYGYAYHGADDQNEKIEEIMVAETAEVMQSC
jgi:hypothetical protein